jgi:hypothetical protein
VRPAIDVGTPPTSRFSDPYLLRTLLFLALIFVPSGLYLVWQFPSWETMHAGDRGMPGWLVTAFALTNVTQGILGYLVAEWLIARGRTYLAYLQIVVGYVGMFFLLVHGWDATGYQRFFSADRQDFLAWDGDWTAWLTSEVALTLLVMGAVLVPTLLVMAARWHTDGHRLAGRPGRRPGKVAVAALMLATVFGAALGVAIAAHLAIVWLGAPLGLPVALVLGALALAPHGPVHALYRRFGFPEAETRRATAPRLTRARVETAA